MVKEYPKKTGLSLKGKIIWCAIVTVLIGGMIFAIYVYDYQISKVVPFFIGALFMLTVIYVQETNSTTGAKLIYIGIGAVLLGMFLWFLSWSFANAVKLQGINLDLFLITSLLVCCSIGGLVGNWLGKKRQYKWPPFIAKF
jgi:CDP-diglyceride synthetase